MVFKPCPLEPLHKVLIAVRKGFYLCIRNRQAKQRQTFGFAVSPSCIEVQAMRAEGFCKGPTDGKSGFLENSASTGVAFFLKSEPVTVLLPEPGNT